MLKAEGREQVFHIVTPAYNAATYIDETISSVVTQAGNFAIRYHVQDGGSTDGTCEKLQMWEERLQSPSPLIFCNRVEFTWDSGPDKGMYDAINKGFARLAPPDDGIMAWVNADDPYLPRAFSTACLFFETAPGAEWVGGKVLWLGENGGMTEVEGYNYYPREYIVRGLTATGEWWCIQQNGCFWKAGLWRKAGPLDASMRYAADALIWVAFAQYADFHHFSAYVGMFRSRTGQLSLDAAYMEEIHSRLGTRSSFFLPPIVLSPATCYRSFPIAYASGYVLYRWYTYSAIKFLVFSYLRPVKRVVRAILKRCKRLVKRCLRIP